MLCEKHRLKSLLDRQDDDRRLQLLAVDSASIFLKVLRYDLRAKHLQERDR